MLLRLWQRLRPRPQPLSLTRQEPVVDIAAFVPPPARRGPSSTAVSDHYPPLTRKLSPVDQAAGAFEGERQPGDEVWAFHSPAEDWQAKGGRSGVVLVRDGHVVRSIVTLLN